MLIIIKFDCHMSSNLYMVEWPFYHKTTQAGSSYEFLLWNLEPFRGRGSVNVSLVI